MKMNNGIFCVCVFLFIQVTWFSTIGKPLHASKSSLKNVKVSKRAALFAKREFSPECFCCAKDPESDGRYECTFDMNCAEEIQETIKAEEVCLSP